MEVIIFLFKELLYIDHEIMSTETFLLFCKWEKVR